MSVDTELVDAKVQQSESSSLEVAERLLKSGQITCRDRGRHMLMALADGPDDWLQLALRFLNEFDDLRQQVLERFLRECPDNRALEIFIWSAVRKCFSKLQLATFPLTNGEVSYMHWILSCLNRLERSDKVTFLLAAIRVLTGWFGSLPPSVFFKAKKFLPGVPLTLAGSYDLPISAHEPALEPPAPIASVVSKPAEPAPPKPELPTWRPRKVEPVPDLNAKAGTGKRKKKAPPLPRMARAPRR